jgi:uncharacterized protein (TIRG00374 family)
MGKMEYRNLRKLRYGFAAGLIILLAYFANLNTILSEVSKANFALYSGAVLVFLSVYVWSALRWKTLLEGLGYSLTFSNSLKVIAISYSFNKILPLNSGDLTRSKLMEHYIGVESHGKILGAVAMERFLDVCLLAFVTSISSIYLIGMSRSLLWILTVSSLLIFVMIYARVRNKQFIKLLEVAENLGLPKNVRKIIADGLKGFSEISKLKLLEVALWHSLRWTAGIIVLYILSMSLGASLSLAGATLVTGVMSLVAALPITPGGIGPVEAFGAGTLILIGLPAVQASALVILQRSLGLVLMGSLGVFVYALD